MTSSGKEKIINKFQELVSVIKEEAVTESKDIRKDIIDAVEDIKVNLSNNWDKLEDKSKEKMIEIKGTQDKVQDNLAEMMKDLEAKALKVQYTVQEKYSQGAEKKDEVVVKTADALVEAIHKAKKALTKE